MSRRLALVFAALVASTFSRSDALAEGPQMVITDAIPNLTIPASILIEGQKFRPAGLRDPNPLVFIGVAGGDSSTAGNRQCDRHGHHSALTKLYAGILPSGRLPQGQRQERRTAPEVAE